MLSSRLAEPSASRRGWCAMYDDRTREPNALEPTERSCGCGATEDCGCGCAPGSCGRNGTATRSDTGPQRSRGRVVPLFSRRQFVFTNLAALSSIDVVLVRAQPVVDFADAVVRLRVHGATIPAGASIELLAQAIAPCGDEPQTDFLGPQLGSIELDSSTTAPSLHSVALSPDFGSHVQFLLRATQGSLAAFTADLSADLVLKERAVEPALLRAHTWHSYTKTDAALAYIPFVSNVEGTALDDNAPSLRMVAPHDGWLERAVVYATSDPATPVSMGVTVVGLHLNESSTPTPLRSETLPHHTGVVYEFGPEAKFVRGDTIAVSVDPTTGPWYVNVHCEWVFRRGT